MMKFNKIFCVRSRLFFIVWGVMIISGCATLPREPSVDGVTAARQLNKICKKHEVDWRWDSVSQIIVLSKNGAEARALAGSNIVMIASEKVELGAAVRFEQSMIVVPDDFEGKVIVPLLQRKEERPDFSLQLIKKVVIDAGHGGKDPGAISASGVKEKDIVLDIANRLKKFLESEGIEVVMTRDSDVFIPLQERTEIVIKSKADFFISVHANSSPDRHVQGVEVFTLKDLDRTERDEPQRLLNQEAFLSQLNMCEDEKLNHILDDMLYTLKQQESALFADKLADIITQATSARNRGQKESRFYVLRNTLIPAVLVEVGFLTNEREEAQLLKKEYRQKIAYGLAESILEYAHGQ